MNFKKSILLLTLLSAGAAVGRADTVTYLNGFESGTGDWNGAITQTASGAGPLGVTAYQGSYYGTVQSDPSGYLPGYGDGGYTFYGGGGGAQAYPGLPFGEEISIYIDVNTPPPTNPNIDAFWVDFAPSSTDPVNGPMGYGGEHNLQVTYTGSSVSVSADGVANVANITQSGWYTFQAVYAKGATATSLSTATLSVIATDGKTVLGSDTLLNNEDGTTLESQYLGGPGYEWFPSWQDGFSNNTLAIDNIEAFTVTPEPSSFLLLGSGILTVAGAIRRRIQTRR
jgi:hypothetical protein